MNLPQQPVSQPYVLDSALCRLIEPIVGTMRTIGGELGRRPHPGWAAPTGWKGYYITGRAVHRVMSAAMPAARIHTDFVVLIKVKIVKSVILLHI